MSPPRYLGSGKGGGSVGSGGGSSTAEVAEAKPKQSQGQGQGRSLSPSQRPWGGGSGGKAPKWGPPEGGDAPPGSGGTTATTATFVPWRSSKLTRVLQASLSGACSVSLLVNIAPEDEHVPESINSLTFGKRTKHV